MSDLIGKVICGYRIVSEVGAGGMGKVYLAESAFLTEYKQQVAIKTLTAHTSSERQAALLRDLFIREANIQVQLKHPQIVNVIQFAVEGDEYFLILEYVPGYEHQGRRIRNMADMIECETGPVPHQRALKLFTQVLDALNFAHNFRYRWEGEERVGLVHRDIKPGNLLLVDPETIKVSDFGIVKVRHRVRSMTTMLTPGTSAYMSPEAILGPSHFGLTELDRRSDIYALGVTLYEMLAGRLPFEPDEGIDPDLALRRKHVDQQPPPPSTFYPAITPRLDQIVLRALEKKPEQRYQTAAEFKQAIEELSAERPPTVLMTLPDSVPATTRLAAVAETRPNPSAATAAPAASATAMSAGTSTAPPAARTPAPEIAREPAAPAPRSSRLIYLSIIMVLILGALGAAAVIFRQPTAGSEAKVESTPSPQPSASATPAPLPTGMALIPGGNFLMGRNLSEAEKQVTVSDEAGHQTKVFTYDYPAHEVKVAPFYLDLTEVSNREYADFVRASSHAPPQGWRGTEPSAGAEDLPVTNVSYRDAVEYCNWRTAERRDGLAYRLPAEEEWEFAARGPEASQPGHMRRFYPWGDDWRPGLANTKESRLGHSQIVTANRSGASPFGVLNLSGNVAEWTATDFSHYPGSDQETPREEGYTGTFQVVRGGSFGYPKEWAMTTTRAWAKPTEKGTNIGFRCAADAKR